MEFKLRITPVCWIVCLVSCINDYPFILFITGPGGWKTNLTLPRPLFFTLVSSSLSFHSWIISFIPVINFQVFLFFVFSLLSVFQEHQRKLKFCPVWRLLSPFSIHSFSSPSTYYRLLYCVPSTITCIRWMRVGSCAHKPSIPVEGVRKWTNKNKHEIKHEISEQTWNKRG